MRLFRILNHFFFCPFDLLMILTIIAYTQASTESQLSEPYAKGKQALEGKTGFGGAKGWLAFVNESLSENLTVDMFEDVLGQGEIPLDEFFDKLLLAKNQRHLIWYGILTEEDVKNIMGDKDISLSKFLDQLQNYSQNDVNSKIVNIYGDYNRMRTVLDEENNRFTEGVITDLKKICSEEVKNQLDIAIDNFKKVINESDSEYEVKAYLKLIDVYLVMNREQKAVNIYEECYPKFGFESMPLLINEFQDIFQRLARIYWKGDVKFERTDSRDKIIAFDSEINRATDTHFICSFTSEFKNELFNSKPPLLTEATINFFPAGRELSSKELEKHFIAIVYLPGEEKTTRVKLSNEFILNENKNDIRRIIPVGNYKIVIKIPKLNIKDENRIPFRVNLNGEYILTKPTTQRNTQIILNELILEEQKDQKSKTIEIPCNQDTFTKHNILKAHQVPIGNYDVKIQSSIHLLPGQKYNLSFEPASPMPSQRPWWIITAAIASGVSILTCILQ